MLPAIQSEALCIAVLALLTLWKLPAWGEQMLDLKERWEDYRRKHPGEENHD